MPRVVHGRAGRALAAVVLSSALTLSAALPSLGAVRPDDPVARYADALQQANARLAAGARYELAQRFLLLASYYRIDPALLMAIVTVESSWHARAVSPVGALGFGQLMPATAAGLDVDPLEPYENLDGTARYLRRLLNRYAARNGEQRVRLAVASYNAGPAAVDRFRGVPPYRETQAYVLNVLRWRSVYATLAGAARLDVAHVLTRAVPARPHLRPVRRAHPAAVQPAVAAVPDRPVVAFASLPERYPYDRPSFGVVPRDPYATPSPVSRAKRGFFSRVFARRR